MDLTPNITHPPATWGEHTTASAKPDEEPHAVTNRWFGRKRPAAVGIVLSIIAAAVATTEIGRRVRGSSAPMAGNARPTPSLPTKVLPLRVTRSPRPA